MDVLGHRRGDRGFKKGKMKHLSNIIKACLFILAMVRAMTALLLALLGIWATYLRHQIRTTSTRENKNLSKSTEVIVRLRQRLTKPLAWLAGCKQSLKENNIFLKKLFIMMHAKKKKMF